MEIEFENCRKAIHNDCQLEIHNQQNLYNKDLLMTRNQYLTDYDDLKAKFLKLKSDFEAKILQIKEDEKNK